MTYQIYHRIVNKAGTDSKDIDFKPVGPKFDKPEGVANYASCIIEEDIYYEYIVEETFTNDDNEPAEESTTLRKFMGEHTPDQPNKFVWQEGDVIISKA